MSNAFCRVGGWAGRERFKDMTFRQALNMGIVLRTWMLSEKPSFIQLFHSLVVQTLLCLPYASYFSKLDENPPFLLAVS